MHPNSLSPIVNFIHNGKFAACSSLALTHLQGARRVHTALTLQHSEDLDNLSEVGATHRALDNVGLRQHGF